MKIYTKTGDDGTTSLFSGGRVSKTDLRVEAYGTVDELNAVIGVARAGHLNPQTDQWLGKIQNQLFHLGADLATPPDAKTQSVVRIDAAAVQWLETSIDQMTEELPALKAFILPGGTLVAAQIHVARTVCRRAERAVVRLAQSKEIGPYPLQYLNRLSDFLFVLARWENRQAGFAEEQWSVDRSP
jgi:cob(I)alamin adenosyltransferase